MMAASFSSLPTDQVLFDMLVKLGLLPAYATPDHWHSLVRNGTNDVWRAIMSTGEKIVIKRPSRMPSRSALQEEIHNSRLAASYGLAPEVLFFCPDTGVNVTRYVIGHTLKPKDPQNTDILSAVIDQMKCLHRTEKAFRHTHDYFTRVRDRIQKADALKKAIFPEKSAVLAEKAGFKSPVEILDIMFAVIDRLARTRPTFVPCHSDLVTHNIARTDDGDIRFMDWEVSGMGDPHEDLATFLWSASLTRGHITAALDQYFGASDTAGHHRVQLYLALIPFDWVLRHEIRINAYKRRKKDYSEKLRRQQLRYKEVFRQLSSADFTAALHRLDV